MALSVSVNRVVVSEAAIQQLIRGRQSPVGRDIQARGLRVTRRMKVNASGRPGPNIQTRNLYEAISFLNFGEDAQGLVADIGPQPHRMIRRGYNYALVLEGIIPRGHGGGGVYPFMERSLEAAK